MRRSLFVLVGAVGLVWMMISAAPAHASTESTETCACAPPRILPAPGARDVPRNARIWVVDQWAYQARLDGGDAPWAGSPTNLSNEGMPLRRFDPGPLAEHRAYTFQADDRGPTTQFTTSDEVDTTPPAPPVVRFVGITATDVRDEGQPVAELKLDAALDPDVVLLRFTLDFGTSKWSVITTADGWRWLGRPACHTDMHPVAPGARVSIAISAIDLAGNESAPVVRQIEVWRQPLLEPACARVQHVHCGMGDPALVVLGLMGVVVLIIVLAVWGLVRYLRRPLAEADPVAEPISLLVAERLARAVKHRGGVIAALGFAGVLAGVMADHEVAALGAAIGACLGLRGCFLAHAMLHLIDPGGALVTAEARGPTLIVKSAGREARLDVSPGALAGARRHAVPRSIAKRS